MLWSLWLTSNDFSYNFRSIQWSRGREVLDTWATSWLQRALLVGRYPAIPWPWVVWIYNWVTRLLPDWGDRRSRMVSPRFQSDTLWTVSSWHRPSSSQWMLSCDERASIIGRVWPRVNHWVTSDGAPHLIETSCRGSPVLWCDERLALFRKLRRARCQLTTTRTWWSHMRC